MGVVPDQMKIAKIVPVFKAGNQKILNNYYIPISILPAFSKILEKLVSIRLINFIESQNILYKHQYGFRQNYSTIHKILHLLNDISNANDNKSQDITLAFFRHVEGIWHHKPRHPNTQTWALWHTWNLQRLVCKLHNKPFQIYGNKWKKIYKFKY